MIVDTKKWNLALARTCMGKKALAEAAGISYMTFRNFERGAAVRPSTLGRIARALKMDPADLTKEEPDAAAPVLTQENARCGKSRGRQNGPAAL